MTARARGIVSRFAGVKPDPEHARGISAEHPAAVEGRTIFPTRVTRAGLSARYLISGVNNAKIGGKVTKGPWAGMPILTLTLEERRTCPRSCEVWLDCYGNSQNWPNRWDHTDPDFLPFLGAELLLMGRANPDGFVVRLHVLGDFYSPHYVLFWAEMLARVPALRVYGYTACRIDDPDPNVSKTALAIQVLTGSMWHRFAVRTSSSCSTAARSRAIVVDADPLREDTVVCPAATGATLACSTCGLCWAPNARDKTIAFLRHGMTTRREPRLVPIVVAGKGPGGRPAAAAVIAPEKPKPGRAAAVNSDGAPALAGQMDRAMATLLGMAGPDGAVTASLRVISEKAAVPHGSMIFVLRRLAEGGRLTIEKNVRESGGAVPNTYRLPGPVSDVKPPAPALAVPAPAPQAQRIPPRSLPVPVQAKPLIPARAFEIDEGALQTPGKGSLAQLRAGQCRWPLDDPGPGLMDRTMFCGAPSGEETYCASHTQLSLPPRAARRALERRP